MLAPQPVATTDYDRWGDYERGDAKGALTVVTVTTMAVIAVCFLQTGLMVAAGLLGTGVVLLWAYMSVAPPEVGLRGLDYDGLLSALDMCSDHAHATKLMMCSPRNDRHARPVARSLESGSVVGVRPRAGYLSGRSYLRMVSVDTPQGTTGGKAPRRKSGKGSVLVFGWFQASTRELALVERIYKRNGYDEVVLMPSKIGTLTRPAGWYDLFCNYNTFRNTHPLARHFNVVHCLSGGFLGFYLTRAAGIPLTCDTLLLDSTPILPKPSAFTTFSREFISDAGFRWAINIYPKCMHTFTVRVRWFIGSLTVIARHKLRRLFPPLRLFGRSFLNKPAVTGPRDRALSVVTDWVRMATKSPTGRSNYSELVNDAVKNTVSESSFSTPGPARTIFLYNPDDPYLDQSDIAQTIDEARRLGVEVQTCKVQTSHVQTIFREPKILFGLLSPA